MLTKSHYVIVRGGSGLGLLSLLTEPQKGCGVERRAVARRAVGTCSGGGPPPYVWLRADEIPRI